ncbi:hypothetical protein ACFSCZ_13165 [Siminovitchia sediminis]|uniref:NADH dehydrogenase subunit 3 n=1 Tax=Siminovitchia sediminis TaxID=1274353 RepID=A0ABW4KJ00_9BACI
MMYMIIVSIIVCIAALVGTILVGRDVSRQLKQYEEEGDTLENELARSHAYEKTSLKYNVKRLSWIYAVVLLVVFIVCVGIIYYGVNQ